MSIHVAAEEAGHRPASREDVRQAILDAADRLMLRYGYRKMTVDDIAREAGIGKGTIYLYFPSKEEVALSCREAGNQRLQEVLHRIAKSEAPPVDRVRRILLERVLRRFDGVQPLGVGLDEFFADVRPAFLERRKRWHEEEARILAKVIDDGCCQGGFVCEDPLGTARTMLLATNALLPMGLSPRELGDRQEVAAKTVRLTELMLSGILAR